MRFTKQEKEIDKLKTKGFHIVTWEYDKCCMINKTGSPAEVYDRGIVVYPPKHEVQE